MKKKDIKIKTKVESRILVHNNSSAFFKYLFFAISAFVLVVRPILSTGIGPSSDEVYNITLGDLSYDYITSFGENDSIFRYKPNERETLGNQLDYGTLIDVVATTAYRTLGTDPFPTRHVVITFFCSLLFVFGGLAATKIGGWRAGTLAMLFLLLSPRLFGESLNNPKDPTFAAGYMLGIYGILLVISELPKISWKSAIVLMLGLGLTFAVRAGGLLLFAYTGMFVLLFLWLDANSRKDLKNWNIKVFQDLIIKLAFAFVGAWIIGIALWPAALRSPIGQPLHAVAMQSAFPYVIRVLFGGEYIVSTEVPWTYNPIYILITTPLIVIAGMFLGVVLLPKIKQYFDWRLVAIILFSSFFPLLFIIYKKSTLYNGWRHSYFAYSGLAIFAALGFEILFRTLQKKAARTVLYSILVIGLLLPAIFIAKSFPVSYVYFNELVGGVDGTYGNYQLDYYAASAKPAADWLNENVPFKEGEKLVSNNDWETNVVLKSAKSKHSASYIRYRERNEQDWDYAVFLPQFVDPSMMRKHYFPPKGTIHEVKVENSVIACVVKRENKSDFYGITELKKGDFAKAIPLLEDAVRYDNYNEIAWAYLGIAYAQTGRMQDASNALANSMNISPEYQLPQTVYQQIMQRR
ncbi:MAG TPA: tetratricopeptide repeat protein [Chitinophagales bacterium]